MPSIDVLIRNGRVIDGTGNPWVYADVALAGDRIVEIAPPGSLPVEGAGEVVDAAGLVVCPGFIDIQSHSGLRLLVDGRSLSKITQGVTTEIMGEAWTPAPAGGRYPDPMAKPFFPIDLPEWRERAKGWTRFRDWLEATVANGVSPNIGSFLGGGSLRQFGKGMDLGPANAEELAVMRRTMAAAMEDGAFGVAYALIYAPDVYASTDEIVEVCNVVAEYGGVYITHMRSESDDILTALDEAIEIGRRSGAAVEIYHLKVCGEENWPKMREVIGKINAARAEGIDVTTDQYPYIASGTELSACLPPWASAGGKFFENLRDPEMRAKIRAEALQPTGGWEPQVTTAGPEQVMPVGFEKPENKQYAGKRLSEIAAMRGQEWVDAVIDLLISEEQRPFTIYFKMSEENIRLQLQQPWNKISTDAWGIDPLWAAEDGLTHPRAYGTYPRVLGKYVREEGVLPLEEAIRKMTSAVAARLSLRDRGLLQRGQFADVVIFDPATIGDRATFEEPHQLSVGVRDVWINGARVLRDGEHTGALPGRVVDGPGRR
ncbi:MAG TPA: D-aminoacylase [Nitrolancea sp.]|nr:D-aminoacylase [Nitrolancea sp.]